MAEVLAANDRNGDLHADVHIIALESFVELAVVVEFTQNIVLPDQRDGGPVTQARAPENIFARLAFVLGFGDSAVILHGEANHLRFGLDHCHVAGKLGSKCGVFGFDLKGLTVWDARKVADLLVEHFFPVFQLHDAFLNASQLQLASRPLHW